MFSYLKQFNSSEYSNTYVKTKVETICQSITTFKEAEIQVSNGIEALEQVKAFKQTRQEEITQYIKVSKYQSNLNYQFTKQIQSEKFGIISSLRLKGSQSSNVALSSVSQLALLRLFKKSFTLVRISDLYRKEEQTSSQTVNSSQTDSKRIEQDFYQTNNEFSIPVVLDKNKRFNSNAKLQRKVLLKIDDCQTQNGHNPVEWKPVVWFGEGNITTSMRSNWSKALKTLVEKELVYKQIVSNRQASGKSGNILSLVSLTAKGRKYTKQMRNNDIDQK